MTNNFKDKEDFGYTTQPYFLIQKIYLIYCHCLI